MSEPVAPLIVANFDCELDFATVHPQLAGRFRRPRLAPAKRRRLGRLARLLEVLGDRRSHLWSPRGEARPPSGWLAGPILAWGETPGTEKLRATVSEAERGALPQDGLTPLARLLWRLPVASALTTARVNHREFFLSVCERLNLVLPGSRMVASLADIERAQASNDTIESWILKTPLSAAGQGQILLPADGPADERLRARILGALRLYGKLLIEPCLERLDDFGLCAFVSARDCRALSLHRLLVDGRGRPIGIAMTVEPLVAPGLGAAEAAYLTSVAERIGEDLAAHGYSGPFGIDAWTHVDGGGIALRAPGEINARLTFGFVARCWLERLLEGQSLTAGDTATLWLAAGREGESHDPAGEAAHLEVRRAASVAD